MTKKYTVAFAALGLACTADNGASNDDNAGTMGITIGADDTAGDADADADAGVDADADAGNDADADAGNDTGNADADAGDDAPPAPLFDVGAGGSTFCKYKDAGIYCDDRTAVTCGDEGNVVETIGCVPQVCLEGTGCVPCLEGSIDCQGPNVVQCSNAGGLPDWQILETCDASAQQVCDIALGTCSPATIVGGTEPTGEYYEYAFIPTGAEFQGGYDPDGLGNRLWVSQYDRVDVYDVELQDTDGDGVLEPNQHPLNPDEMGEIEERDLVFIESLVTPVSLSPGSGELYVSEDKIYAMTSALYEFTPPMMTDQVIVDPPSWQSWLSHLGYDDVNDVWYSSSESYRRVYNYDSNTMSWGISFDYPNLAGSHMDGMEVVPNPTDGIVYVYVSDMTSDFIGQYKKDATMGWVQENVFSYQGTGAALLEGMGYGPLSHFWATSGSALYELGGGELQTFLPPTG